MSIVNILVGTAIGGMFIGAICVVLGFVARTVYDEKPALTCPPNYSTEYTSSGHKFCLRVLPECERKE